MKKIILLALLFTASYTIAQEKQEVPSATKKTFDSLYPKAEVREWNMRHGNYEASFTDENGKLFIVEIEPDGKLFETEMETAVSMLPNEIIMYVIKYYPGIHIKKAYTVTRSDGTILFRAEVGETDLLFDTNGIFKNSEDRKITPVGEPERVFGNGTSDK